jgi:Protein of Unknown function (DUF2784).
MTSIFLADVVYVVHFVICMFLWFGCLLPSRFLVYHMVVILLIDIQFILTDDKCVLTVLEDDLRNRPSSYSTGGESPFFGRIFSFLGITDNNYLSNLIASSLVRLSFVISFIRYCIG